MTREEREQAIAIIRREYLCVDRDCDIEKNCGRCDLMMPRKEPILQAYKMAMDALEQEPIDKSAMMHEIYMEGVNMSGEYQGCWVRFKDIEKIVDKYMGDKE